MVLGTRAKTYIACICAIIALAQSSLSAVTGEEAVERFKARFYSISTMKGVISVTFSSGEMFTGSFKYMAPGKFQIKFSAPAGKIITTNGRKLWVYDTNDNVCGVQDAGGLSGGVAGLINGYIAISNPSGAADTVIKLKSPDHTRDITILVDGSYMLKKVMFRRENGDGFTATLSGIVLNESMSPGNFDYNVPANAQVVKNPLNVR
jgi:outer membrane lipoprotein-sorting protein